MILKRKKNTHSKKYERMQHSIDLIQNNKNLSESEKQQYKNFLTITESMGLDEFLELIQSPWRIFWMNFVAGMIRGIGALIGAAVVIALIGWLLSKVISLPLIGEKLEPYIHQAQSEIQKYTESTNYKNNFEQMQKTLQEIRDELKKNPV